MIDYTEVGCPEGPGHWQAPVELGGLYRFEGVLVKARWINGDDAFAWFDAGDALDPDEPGLFVYADDGSEQILCCIGDDGSLLDTIFRRNADGKLYAQHTCLGHVNDLVAVEPPEMDW